VLVQMTDVLIDACVSIKLVAVVLVLPDRFEVVEPAQVLD